MCVARTAPPIRSRTRAKYPGVAIGARGKTVPVGSCTAMPAASSGCGCSLIPTSTQRQRRSWDAQRVFQRPGYYNDKKLVRPYRVGMSCGFCHVGPSPMHPPADPANPQWPISVPLSARSTCGWIACSSISANPDNFIFQLVHTYRPGAMDTSLVSTDNINNPRTMNAVYNLGAAA